MKPITMEDLDELDEGMLEDNIYHLKTAYGQVQYVFDELGTGFNPLTAKRINVLIGRLNCATSNLREAAENMKIYDDIFKGRGDAE